MIWRPVKAMLTDMGLVCLAAILALGCAPEPEPLREPFVAIEADFQGFRDWPSFKLPPASLVPDSHASGVRRLYASAMPAEPGGPFPVGTILVKAVETDDPATWQLHAMAKRGGGYNDAGARGWEFFDLAIDAAGAVTIRWRGEGPPPGAAGYPGDGTGDGQCNGCHGLVADRDYVFDRDLFP